MKSLIKLGTQAALFSAHVGTAAVKAGAPRLANVLKTYAALIRDIAAEVKANPEVRETITEINEVIGAASIEVLQHAPEIVESFKDLEKAKKSLEAAFTEVSNASYKERFDKKDAA